MLRLFGLDLPVADNGSVGPIAPGGAIIAVSDDTLLSIDDSDVLSASGTLTLISSFLLRFSLQLHVSKDGTGSWKVTGPVKGSQGQFLLWSTAVEPFPEPPPAMALRTALLNLSGTWTDPLVVEDDVYFAVGVGSLIKTPPTEAYAAPLIALRLEDGAVRFGPGSFKIIVNSQWKRWSAAFQLQHLSYRIDKQFASLDRLDLRCLPSDPQGLMALGVDIYEPANPKYPPTAANPLVAGISISNHDLIISLKPANGVPQVSSLSVAPRRLSSLTRMTDDTEPVFVRAFGLGSSSNEPLELHCDVEIPLQVRVDSGDRCASLQISTMTDDSTGRRQRGAIPLRVAYTSNGFATIHGGLDQAVFKVPEAAAIRCHHADANPLLYADYAPDVQTGTTLPYIEFGAGAMIHLAKPGFSYTSSDAAKTVETLSFSQGNALRLPLTRPAVIERLISEPTKTAHLAYLDEALLDHAYTLPPAVKHETSMLEEPATTPALVFHRLFQALAQPRSRGSGDSTTTTTAVQPQDVQFDTYDLTRDYGIVKVTLNVPTLSQLDYVVLRQGDGSQISILQTGLDGGFQINTAPPSSDISGRILGVVKLSQTCSLHDIVDREDILHPDHPFSELSVPVSPTSSATQPVTDLIEPTIYDNPLWFGVMLFGAAASMVDSSDPLTGLLAGLALPLVYLAVTPKRGQTPGVTAYLYLVNANPITDIGVLEPQASGEYQDPNETAFRLDYIEASWYDSSLNLFNAGARLWLPGFLGRSRDIDDPKTDPKISSPIVLDGTYDRATKKLGLIGRLPTPYELIPPSWASQGFPIASAQITTLGLRSVNNVVSLIADGTITLQNFALAGISLDPSNGLGSISFSGLQIPVPSVGVGGYNPLAKNSLRFLYPSFNFHFNMPPFALGPFRLTFESLAVDWSNAFNWGSVVEFTIGPGTVPNGGSLVFGLRLELMKLPELALKGLDRLILELYLGFGLNNASQWLDPYVGVGAFAFDKLHLDLIRFLEIDAEKLEIFAQTNGGVTTKWIGCQNASVAILGETIIENFSFFFFKADEETGFVGYLSSGSDSPTIGFLSTKWVLIGHNIALSDTVAAELINVNPDSDQAIADEIDTDIRQKHLIAPSGSSRTLNGGRWVFAGAFTFGGVLDVKFLFADGAHYGMAINGPIFKDIFGSEFGISVLYNKAPRPTEDSFDVSVHVPQITMGPVHFTGGVISIEVVMNGGFTVDLGFPTLCDGVRHWERCLGAIVTPFQGKGGMYLQKHAALVARRDWFEIAAGYGVEFGLGASGGGGAIFSVWVSVGVTATLEGRAEWTSGTLTLLQLTGTIGILVTGGAELNFWIISAHVSVSLGAEAQVTLTWSRSTVAAALPRPVFGLPGAREQAQSIRRGDAHVTLQFDATVYVVANGEACLGGGWFKICKSVSVTLPLHYSFQFQL